MSKDTIYREDAIKAVENVSENYTKEGDREWHPHIDFITQALVQVPSVSTKRGEWVKRTHNTLIAQVNFAYCSECGQPIMHEHTRSLWNFCPNCGADMRKGADDEIFCRRNAELL